MPTAMIDTSLNREKKWEIGIDMHTLLYIKSGTDKYFLHCTENSPQHSEMTYMGKESKEEWINVCA